MTDVTHISEDPLVDATEYYASPGDYFALLKPRVMSLVVFTGLVGLILAPGYIHPVLGFTAILCIAIGAGASGALNMWYDADIDAVMERTKSRPIPSGRVKPGEALGFGLTLSIGSVAMLGLMVNWVAAFLLAFTIFFYMAVYTMLLKRRTAQNIVIGGAAGAFPPIIGWAAVTGSVSLESIALFAIIFIWTPPHFWALALFKTGEYAKVGVPMLPVVAGKPETRRQILIYTLLLVPVSLSPWFLGFASIYYGGVALLLGAGFLYAVTALLRAGDGPGANKAAGWTFTYSIAYLFLIFAALLTEGLIAKFVPGVGG